MKMMKTLLAAAVVAASVPAMAYEAGDIMVKAGAISVAPENSETSAAEISENTQLGITATYMFHSKWGVELLAATPFEHNIDAGVATGKTKHLPPTVSLQYYPLSGENSNVQPYFGVGINYTTFFDDEVLTVGGVAADADLDLKDSWGVAYSAGVNVGLTDNVMANVAVWKMDIDTKVGALNGARATIDPTVFLVGVGYKF